MAMVRTSRRVEEDSSPIRGGVGREREEAVPERTVRLARKATYRVMRRVMWNTWRPLPI